MFYRDAQVKIFPRLYIHGRRWCSICGWPGPVWHFRACLRTSGQSLLSESHEVKLDPDVNMFLRGLFLFFSLLLAVSPALAGLPAAVDGQPLPSLAPVLKEVTPSVVNINTETRVRVRSPLLDDPIFRHFFNFC